MRTRQTFFRTRASAGFTLLEVLVALAIIGTALGACLRAVGSLTSNSETMRDATLATWSAENRFANIRIEHEWPSLGSHSFDCSQGGIRLLCKEDVTALPNPDFRRVEINVMDGTDRARRIIRLTEVVPNVM